jgi:hypothetical protein
MNSTFAARMNGINQIRLFLSELLHLLTVISLGELQLHAVDLDLNIKSRENVNPFFSDCKKAFLFHANATFGLAVYLTT